LVLAPVAKISSVEHFNFYYLFEFSYLAGRKVIVEYHDIGIELFDPVPEHLSFAPADISGGMDPPDLLLKTVNDKCACTLGQGRQFDKIIIVVCLPPAPENRPYKNGSFFSDVQLLTHFFQLFQHLQLILKPVIYYNKIGRI